MKNVHFSALSIVALTSAMVFGGPVLAQAGGAWQFRWQKGQTLDYRVEHSTSVAETANGNRVETSSRLNLVKRWQVIDVDARNVATLQLTLMSLRHEQTRPNGGVLLFNSMDPSGSDPELREQMGPLIGKILASVRIDGSGQVVQVIQGTASGYEAEPPFLAVLPGQALNSAQAWQRNYQIVLDPPVGTGEKYAARQTYKVASFDKGRALLRLTTEMLAQPDSVADRIPLLQKQPQGQIVFDVPSGRLISANLTIDKTLENHQGAGSNYRFQSRYSEELVNP